MSILFLHFSLSLPLSRKMLAQIIRNLSIHVRANTYNHTAQPLAILRVYICQKI